MNLKITLPHDLTTYLLDTKGEKSLAAYVVSLLREHHKPMEANNERTVYTKPKEIN